MAETEKPPLRLAQSDSADMAPPWIGGVASGVAARYGLPVGPVRFAFAALSALGGLGIVAYMWIWLTTPTDEAATLEAGQDISTGAYRSPMRAVGKRRDNQVISGRLLIAGSIFLLVAFIVGLGGIISGVVVGAFLYFILGLAGLMLVWMQAPKLADERRPGVIAFVVLGSLMAVSGGIGVIAQPGLVSGPGAGIAYVLVALIIIAFALAPLGMRIVGDLTAARAREAREIERADIAAHLHDSVLQTLTLIRGAADDPARVRALALTQERELRSWLYTGQTEPEVSVAKALQNQASLIEITYGVPVEVVTVGDMQPGPRQLAAVAAATEAMTNSVKHGAPPITVFQEARAGALEIFVKDAGDGFDPHSIPPDRHGFTNSIVGRVARVGGTVDVHFLPPTEGASILALMGDNERKGEPRSVAGTEIRITLPRSNDDPTMETHEKVTAT